MDKTFQDFIATPMTYNATIGALVATSLTCPSWVFLGGKVGAWLRQSYQQVKSPAFFIRTSKLVCIHGKNHSGHHCQPNGMQCDAWDPCINLIGKPTRGLPGTGWCLAKVGLTATNATIFSLQSFKISMEPCPKTFRTSMPPQ